METLRGWVKIGKRLQAARGDYGPAKLFAVNQSENEHDEVLSALAEEYK